MALKEYGYKPHKRSSTDKVPLVLLLVILAGILLLDKFLVWGLNWVDYTIIGIVFFSAFVGYVKGLIGTIFSLVGYVVAVICAVLFAEPLAIMIMEKTRIGEAVAQSLEGLYSGISIPAFSQSLDLSGIQSNNQLIDKSPELQQLFSENTMLKQLFENANPFASGFEVIGNSVSSITDVLVFSVLKMLAIIAIFLIVKLVVVLIGRFVNSLISYSNFLSTTNKTIGLVLGGVIGCLVVFVAITYIIPFIDSMNIIKMPDEYRQSMVLGWLFMSFASVS